MRYNRLTVLFLIIVSIIVLLTVFYNNVHIYDDEFDIAPTCETEGGRFHRCVICGKNECLFETEPTGHIAEWKKLSEASAINKGLRQLRCSYCNKLLESELIHSVIYQHPTIHLYGGGYMSYHVYDDVKFSFTDREDILNYSQNDIEQTAIDAKIKIYNEKESQRAKFNYLVEGFTIDGATNKLLIGNNSADRIIIYANNDDNTTMRRNVFLELWNNIASTHGSYYDFFKNADGNVIYSKNVLMYIRNKKPTYTFSGIYTVAPPYESYVKDAGYAKYIVKYNESSEQKLEYVFGVPEDKERILDNLSNYLEYSSDISNSIEYDVIVDYAAFSLLTANAKAFTDLYWVSKNGTDWYPVPNSSQHIFGSFPGKNNLISPTNSIDIPVGFWSSVFEYQKDDIDNSVKRLLDEALNFENVKKLFEEKIRDFEDILYNDNSVVSGAVYESPSSAVSKLVSWYIDRTKFILGE